MDSFMKHFITHRKLIIGSIVLMILSCILGALVTADCFLVSLLSAYLLISTLNHCFTRLKVKVEKYYGLTEQLAYIWVKGDTVKDVSLKALWIGFKYDPKLTETNSIKLLDIEYEVHQILFQDSALYILTPLLEDSYYYLSSNLKGYKEKFYKAGCALRDLKKEHEQVLATKESALDHVEKFFSMNKEIVKDINTAITSFKKIKTKNKTVLPILESIKQKSELYL
jgi:hypothetical protein